MTSRPLHRRLRRWPPYRPHHLGQVSAARDSIPASRVDTVSPATPVPRPRISVAPILSVPPRIANIHAPLATLLEVKLTQSAPASVPVMPVPLHRAQPEYPQREKAQGITGKVELQFRIADDGRVSDIRVLHSTSAVAFEQAAIAALKQWRFAAPSEAGQSYTQSFAFAQEADGRACRERTGSHICRHTGSDEPLE